MDLQEINISSSILMALLQQLRFLITKIMNPIIPFALRYQTNKTQPVEGTFVIQLLNDPSDDFNPTDSNYTSPSGGYQTPPVTINLRTVIIHHPVQITRLLDRTTSLRVNSYQPSPENNQSIPNTEPSRFIFQSWKHSLQTMMEMEPII